MYGQFQNGNYFIYYPELECCSIYKNDVKELINIYYYNSTHEDKISEDEYQRRIEEFYNKYLIKIEENKYNKINDILKNIYDKES